MATERGYYRAEMERAINNIEMALTHIARIVEAYRMAHPDISSQANEIGEALVLIGDAIQALHDSV